MEHHKAVNFLKPQTDFSPSSNEDFSSGSKKPPRRAAKLFACASILGVLSIMLLCVGVAHTEPSDISDAHSLFASLRHLVGARERANEAASDDRITVLLLGIGGAGHAGAELTDTMILASIKPSTGQVGMISIPRDLTLSLPGRGYTKLNAVNAYAEQDAKGSGLAAITKTISEIMDEPIDYTMKINFASFEEMIDAVGGIDVMVTTTFEDSQYPVNGMEDAVCETSTNDTGEVQNTAPAPSSYGCRYEVLSFTKGMTHMNGATALKFARSRHGNNGEGSDFARAARQQKVLLAWKEKITSAGTLLNPTALQNIASTVREHVSTTMSLWDMLDLAKYAKNIDTQAIASHVIDGKSGLVYDSHLGASYVLLPRKEDWSEFRALADNIFTSSSSSTELTTTTMPTSQPESHIRVDIQNGTSHVGLASQTAQLLQSSGYAIANVGNAKQTTWTATTIFDFTDGKKATELATLKDYLNAEVIMSSTGALTTQDVTADGIWDEETLLAYQTNTSVDFLIILGENSGTLVLSSPYAH